MEEKTTRYGMTPEKAAEVFTSNNDSKLKKLRVKRGLSQQGLADAAGVKKRLIQVYEQGDRDINRGQLDVLCDISIALGCKVEDILDDEELVKKYRDVK